MQNFYQTVKKMKYSSREDIAIPIESHLPIPCSLSPIIVEMADNKRIISSLAIWRKSALHFIPSTKPITIRGTREWLWNKVIYEPDRLLFLVMAEGKPIGHIGLYRYNAIKRSIVVDNVIRGVTGYPGLMGEAILTLIRWAKQTLSIKTFLVDCSSDNAKAIALYTRIGFKEINREPLIRVKTPGGYVFQDAPKHHTGPIKYFRVLFSMPIHT